MEPDKELAGVFREWWLTSVPDSADPVIHAQDELVSLLEHLHRHGWAVVRRLGGTNG